jgi:hypothetical protein
MEKTTRQLVDEHEDTLQKLNGSGRSTIVFCEEQMKINTRLQQRIDALEKRFDELIKFIGESIDGLPGQLLGGR